MRTCAPREKRCVMPGTFAYDDEGREADCGVGGGCDARAAGVLLVEEGEGGSPALAGRAGALA